MTGGNSTLSPREHNYSWRSWSLPPRQRSQSEGGELHRAPIQLVRCERTCRYVQHGESITILIVSDATCLYLKFYKSNKYGLLLFRDPFRRVERREASFLFKYLMYEKTFTAPQVYISRLLLFVSTHSSISSHEVRNKYIKYCTIF